MDGGNCGWVFREVQEGGGFIGILLGRRGVEWMQTGRCIYIYQAVPANWLRLSANNNNANNYLVDIQPINYSQSHECEYQDAVDGIELFQ